MFTPFPPVCLSLAVPRGKEGTLYHTSEGLLPMLGFNMMAVTILAKDMFPVSRSVRREGSYQEARARLYSIWVAIWKMSTFSQYW